MPVANGSQSVLGVSVRRALSASLDAPAADIRSAGVPLMRSAPQRFIETWVDAVLGFLFCVVLPIPIYATAEPFAKEFGAA